MRVDSRTDPTSLLLPLSLLKKKKTKRFPRWGSRSSLFNRLLLLFQIKFLKKPSKYICTFGAQNSKLTKFYIFKIKIDDL